MATGTMSEEACRIIVEGMKELGIDFVASLPDDSYGDLYRKIRAEKNVTFLNVSEEGLGFAACAGAWYGGKKPVFLTSNAGVQNMCWAISAFKNYHAPLTLFVIYRGVLGEGLWFMKKYVHKIERYLELFDIGFIVVNKLEEIKPAMRRAETTRSKLMIPTAILFSGDTIW